MEFYEAVEKRRIVREFLDKEVDFEVIKKILEAGNKAPTWNHNRNWSFIILKTDEEKEYAFEYAKKIAEIFEYSKTLSSYTCSENVCICNAKTIYNVKKCSLCNNSCV